VSARGSLRERNSDPHGMADLQPDGRPSIGLAAIVRSSATGMCFSSRMPYEIWSALGPRIAAHANASRWWLGDWVVFGERRYGHRYRVAIQATGLDYQTLRNYAASATTLSWPAASTRPVGGTISASSTTPRSAPCLITSRTAGWILPARTGGQSRSCDSGSGDRCALTQARTPHTCCVSPSTKSTRTAGVRPPRGVNAPWRPGSRDPWTRLRSANAWQPSPRATRCAWDCPVAAPAPVCIERVPKRLRGLNRDGLGVPLLERNLRCRGAVPTARGRGRSVREALTGPGLCVPSPSRRNQHSGAIRPAPARRIGSTSQFSSRGVDHGRSCGASRSGALRLAGSARAAGQRSGAR
jgi:hypothetical protein